MTDTTSMQTGDMSGQLAGTVLFYGKPEPLSLENHGNLGINPSDKPYAFVAQSNIVPLTVTEFAPAALSFPVIFVGDNRQPVAVLGLRQGDNLFVDDGVFRSDAYIPAYVRRYPFVFANDEAQKRLIMCVDRQAPFLVEGGQQPLFKDGQPSEFTQQAMEFCNNFEQERLRTESFVKLIQDLDLLDVREAVFTPRGPNGEAGRILCRVGRQAEGPARRQAGRAARQWRSGPDLQPPDVAAGLGPSDRPDLPACCRPAGRRQRLTVTGLTGSTPGPLNAGRAFVCLRRKSRPG